MCMCMYQYTRVRITYLHSSIHYLPVYDMFIHECIRVCNTEECIYECIHECIHVCIYECIHECIHVSNTRNQCSSVCMCMCMYQYTRVCMCMCMYQYTRVCIPYLHSCMHYSPMYEYMGVSIQYLPMNTCVDH